MATKLCTPAPTRGSTAAGDGTRKGAKRSMRTWQVGVAGSDGTAAAADAAAVGVEGMLIERTGKEAWPGVALSVGLRRKRSEALRRRGELCFGPR